MFATRSIGRQALRIPRWTQARFVSSLEGNPHIYVFPNQGSNNSHILSLLSSEPVNPDLAIGVTSQLPPTPDSLRENPKFLGILQEVFAKHAHEDPDAQSQAQVMVSTAGANLYTGGVLMPNQRNRRRTEAGDSSGGASGQGGAGGAGKGGWIHISDNRRPPSLDELHGTALMWPEDIFGSLEVDGHGQFVGGDGKYQSSGTYRMVTRDGILGLTPFLREKLVQRLRELDNQ
ncbi:uncharacterized protein N7473_002248 [Penicillium subrubescens]|uniref:uncharacterized protein n=1 Tax=Penicillium subrubescens TaxID=1316194 RepID=UPI0025455A2A|nr:uncharacterized protein N7473_002248 [Penicillium subrubescens]KAJ5905332.1 hypothetical protein N7473_002248 [Penicillium subrubescens]